eukprot:1921913-Pyramimonas_sp.AAC.1
MERRRRSSTRIDSLFDMNRPVVCHAWFWRACTASCVLLRTLTQRLGDVNPRLANMNRLRIIRRTIV